MLLPLVAIETPLKSFSHCGWILPCCSAWLGESIWLQGRKHFPEQEHVSLPLSTCYFLTGNRHVPETRSGNRFFQRILGFTRFVIWCCRTEWCPTKCIRVEMTHHCLTARLYQSAHFRFHQKGVYSTVQLFQKGLLLAVDAERSCLTWQGFIPSKTSRLLLFLFFFRWTFHHFCSHTLFCCSPKLKVNSTYCPLLERPLACGERHPVWILWQTEILIIPPLLGTEEVEKCFVGFF